VIANPSDLGRVLLRVFHVDAYHISQRYAATLDVRAGFIEILGDKMMQQIVIFRAQLEKALQTVGGVAPAVTKICRPKLFVERFQNRIRVCDQTPEAPCRDNLGVGQVRGDLPETPRLFVRSIVDLRRLCISKSRYYQISSFSKALEKLGNVVHMDLVVVGTTHVIPAQLA
jgi:hypothetical protein